VVLGEADVDVPPDLSRRYFEAKKKIHESVAVVEIAKADHFDLIDPRSAAWPKVEAAVLHLLG
jgi:pimeloyl-ACP methyl ester carboxylesterase